MATPIELKVTWEFRREVHTPMVLYDRVGDFPNSNGGSAALYGGPRARTFLAAINGVEYVGDIPDCGGRYGGDRGNPLGARLRYEPAWGWVLSMYMFAGDNNPRSEWVAVLGVWGLS